MGPAFDPYHKWLGIPRQDQPPDFYRLLGIQQFESDLDVIQAAADQRMAHLRNYQTGPHSKLSQQLLNEVASARVCLLNVAKKAAYDERLRAQFQEKLEAAQDEYPLAAPIAPAEDLLDGLPYGSPPRASARKRSRGFEKHFPIAALLGCVSVVGVLVIGFMYWSGLDTSAVAVKPRGVSAEGTAKIARQGDHAIERKANRGSQTPDKQTLPEMSGPPSSTAQPTAAPPSASPSEPSQTKPTVAAGDTESKLPPGVEANLPEPSVPVSPPPSLEPAEKMSETLPPVENVPPVEALPGEQKSAERAATARVRVRFNRWFDLLNPRNELSDWEVNDCRYRYEDRIIELDDGYMFCPIVTKDAMIRAKVRRSGSGAHVYLVLRNSDEGCYVAGLEDHTVKILRLKQFAGADKKQPMHMRRAQELLGEFTLPQGKPDVATVVFAFGFSAVGDTLAAYINADFPLLAVKDKQFSEGTVGIGVRNNTRAYFTDVEMKIPNKAAFVADLRPLPSATKSSGSNELKVPPAK